MTACDGMADWKGAPRHYLSQRFTRLCLPAMELARRFAVRTPIYATLVSEFCDIPARIKRAKPVEWGATRP